MHVKLAATIIIRLLRHFGFGLLQVDFSGENVCAFVPLQYPTNMGRTVVHIVYFNLLKIPDGCYLIH